MFKASKKITKTKTFKQLFKYGLIGIGTNVSAYIAYVLITSNGGTPKITMSALYVIAAIVSFYGNRTLTFSHQGSAVKSGLQFVLMHCLGYLINLSMLYYLVDKLGHPHQWVQMLAIIVVAIFLFIAFKFSVFRETKSKS